MRPTLSLLCLPPLAGALVLLASCWGEQKKVRDYMDLGTYQDGTYRNDFFDLEYSPPGGYVVAGREQIDEIMELGSQMVAAEEGNDELVKVADVTTVTLFFASRHEVGAAVESNPNVIIGAERISHAPGIKDTGDYLFHLKNQFRSQNSEFLEEGKTLQVGGKEFELLVVRTSAMGFVMKQTYALRKIGDFVLFFVVSHDRDEDASREIMDSIRDASLGG